MEIAALPGVNKMRTLEAEKRQKSAGERRVKPMQEEISRLAYELFEREGRPDGRHLDHWFNAEAMVENNFGCGRDHSEHDFSQTTGEE